MENQPTAPRVKSQNISEDSAPKMDYNLAFWGIGLSLVAYCVVLFVACRSKTWRQSELNWCWLIATGFEIVGTIADEYSFNDVMQLVVEYLSLASISWTLAGGLVAAKKARDSEANVMSSAALFGMLAPLPLCIFLIAMFFFPYEDKVELVYFVLLHVQVGLTLFMSVTLFAYSIWYIVRNSGSDQRKVVIFLIFSLYFFLFWLLGIAEGTLINGESEETASVFQMNLDIISSFGVFVFSVIHIVFIKENKRFITCSQSVSSTNPESVVLQPLK